MESLGAWEEHSASEQSLNMFEETPKPQEKIRGPPKMHPHPQKTLQVRGSQVYVSSPDGQLNVFDANSTPLGMDKLTSRPLLGFEEEIIFVEELHLWLLHNLVVVGGPSGLCFYRQAISHQEYMELRSSHIFTFLQTRSRPAKAPRQSATRSEQEPQHIWTPPCGPVGQT